jgi:choline dehydrogenase-like flavoprotein
MLFDANDPAVPLNREARVLILGAGPVGLTLAHELAQVADVLLIESGGSTARAELEVLNTGLSVGLGYPLTETRTRRLGGSLSLWAGWIAPFDTHDFEPRAGVRAEGWPFGLEAVQPHYQRSADQLKLLGSDFDVRGLARDAGVEIPVDDGVVVPTAWRFGTPTWRFFEADRERLDSSPCLTVITHLNAVDLRLDDGHSTVRHVAVRTLDGRAGRIEADLVVLACGGLETPRLLLNANGQCPEGVGNGSGMLGRCFMEHPHLHMSALRLRQPERFGACVASQRDSRGREFIVNFGLAAATQQSESVLNARAHVYRTPAMSPHELPRIGLMMEQAPNPASRVTLSEERDRLGLRKLTLDWRLGDREWATFRRVQEIFIDSFERVGVGVRMKADAPGPADVSHSNHHLGTTRMSARADQGVVDPNCRAHDVKNLYLIGGNVFPAVSWANPTFTLLALTYRLADHLRAILRS